MMTGDCAPQPAQKLTYEIQLQGRLSQRWIDWLGDLLSVVEQTRPDPVGDQEPITTVMVAVLDQSALLGLLHKLHNLGFPLLQVIRRDDRALTKGSVNDERIRE